MKKILTMMLLTATLTAAADGYTYLTFQKTDGTLQSVAVDQLTLTYSDATVTATNANGSMVLQLSDLAKMYFSATDESDVTGLERIEATDETVEVYQLSGVFAGRYDSVSAARQQLGRGVYVVKTGEKTYKLQIK